MASQKQLAANRRNALKSTGPKTAAGKAKSRLNAIQHGLLSREVVVGGQFGAESAQDFAALRDRFWRELAPEGPVEEMLVDQMVTAYWRLRRAVRAESGEVARHVDGGQWRRFTRQCREGTELRESFSLKSESALRQSVTGLDHLIASLEDARRVIVESKEVPPSVLDGVVKDCGIETGGVAFMIALLDEWREQNPQGLSPVEAKARQAKVVTEWIDRQLAKYRQTRPLLAAREALIEQSHQLADALPAPETLDKILRYQTTLERQLYRAMNQLERLQRQRSGENIPAPVSMDIGAP